MNYPPFLTPLQCFLDRQVEFDISSRCRKCELLPNVFFGAAILVAICFGVHPGTANAQRMEPSDGERGDLFGVSSSISNFNSVVGSIWDDDNGSNSGSAYFFRQGDSTESAKLLASDGIFQDHFGGVVSSSGDSALIGAERHHSGGRFRGAAYLYRDLVSASGIVHESAKLVASDGADSDSLGSDVSLHQGTGLVGTRFFDRDDGAAYVFRGLDTATGVVQEDAKLVPSEEAESFGVKVSVHGNLGLVGSSSGKVYLYRDLDTITGTVTESAWLRTSVDFDRGVGALGPQISLHENIAVVGTGVFRGLDTGEGQIFASGRLVTSDSGALGPVALSGNVAIGVGEGAYIFEGLDSRSGAIVESVRVTASDSDPGFGATVGFDGDGFVVSAFDIAGDFNRAYAGSVSSMTTLDAGDASRMIFGLSFDSSTNWIVGNETSQNHVLLSDGDTARLRTGDHAVFIGRRAGSNENSLTIAGTLDADRVNVGWDENTGNQLILEATATILIDEISLFLGNSLTLEGEFTTFSLLATRLDSTDLFVETNSLSRLITENNFDQLLSVTFDNGTGFTTLTAVPEPASATLLLFAVSVFATGRRRLTSRSLGR